MVQDLLNENERTRPITYRGRCCRRGRWAERRPKPGFTLVEMLVVITIISILASLVLVGAAAARRAARRAAIKLEIDNIAGAFQEYKQRYGAFPPNLVAYTDEQRALVAADLVLHFKKAFPKHQEPVQLLHILAGRGGRISGGLSPDEAIFFWLGGFSDDARYPISGPGGPAFNPTDPRGEDLEGRNGLYDFDNSRLGPRDGDLRSIDYTINYNGQQETRRINLWTYHPSGFSSRFHYFDTSRHKPYEYDPRQYYDRDNPDPDAVKVAPLKTAPASGAPVSNAALYVFANAGSFQILHAGIDDAWGNFARMTIEQISDGSGILYPTGPFTDEVADTQVNFSTATLADSEP